MKLRFLFMFAVLMFMSAVGTGQKKFEYQTVPNDPTKTRIYTLENGLKVFLAVNKGEPRIQTYIGVRAGAKDDPSTTTGLAHYFEHMMFKGTPKFGTSNWEEESKLIEKIEDLFEVYRNTTDQEKRKMLYKQIDSLSFEASKFAIPNEYDKLMTAIGAQGTNAFTGNDYTAYIENIPSNQIENWAIVQAERFRQPILRLFHTELETVYEEKNMSLVNDGRKSAEALMRGLFPNHPYGTQTVLGDPEHLKNPSMKDINAFFKKYYVANNMAIIMVGEFDPDETIKIIDKQFGGLPKGNAPKFKGETLAPINGEKIIEVVGQEAENISIGFRVPSINDDESLKASLLSMILFNQKAGLIDLNINQKQKALSASASTRLMIDHGFLGLYGRNKTGQTLEELKDLLLAEVKKIKEGNFDDWLLTAAINNLKLQEIQRYEDNNGIASSLVFTFMNRREWSDVVEYNNKLAKISKQDIIEFAKKYLNDNYVVVYKRQGAPTDIPIVDKPSITPVVLNRDNKSTFLSNIESSKVKDIQPSFLDFDKDIQKGKTKSKTDIIYTQNTRNNIFNQVYFFPMGSDHNKYLSLAANYLKYLNTSKYTSEQLNQEFYKLACSYNVFSSRDQTYISLRGLEENRVEATKLLEHMLAEAKVNAEAWKNLVNDVIKSRQDNKKNQRANFVALTNYAQYGDDCPNKYMVTESELKSLNPESLVGLIKSLTSYPHEILYYGPLDLKTYAKSTSKLHKLPKKRSSIPEPKVFELQDTKINRVIFAHYEGPQSQVQTYTRGVEFSNALLPLADTYNEYFGGGMNSIVFQELREKRGLAYSANARFVTPASPLERFRNVSFIATQNDKVIDALTAFNDLFNNIPQSETAFNLSKNSMLRTIASTRVTQMDIIWEYLDNRKMGRDYQLEKMMYEKLPMIDLSDVVDFNKAHVKDRAKTYVILGNEALLDFDALEKNFGKVIKVKSEDYFGY